MLSQWGEMNHLHPDNYEKNHEQMLVEAEVKQHFSYISLQGDRMFK